MNFLKDRRVIALGGGVLALAAGLAVAWLILWRTPAPTEAPPASQGGLVVVSGRDDDAKLDPSRPLRCFVDGKFVGELPLAVCAQRNGVATGALDVGLDPAGALAATNGASSTLTPLPGPQAPPQAVAAAAPPPPPAATNEAASVVGEDDVGLCWRYGAGGWRQLPDPMPLMACVQAIYAGRCPEADEAFYGRWGDKTLRLEHDKVEISEDDHDFRDFVDPWPACNPAPVG